jgi:hypothetical protein
MLCLEQVGSVWGREEIRIGAETRMGRRNHDGEEKSGWGGGNMMGRESQD